MNGVLHLLDMAGNTIQQLTARLEQLEAELAVERAKTRSADEANDPQVIQMPGTN